MAAELLKTFPQTGTNLSKCRFLPPPPIPASRYGNFGWIHFFTANIQPLMHAGCALSYGAIYDSPRDFYFYFVVNA